MPLSLAEQTSTNRKMLHAHDLQFRYPQGEFALRIGDLQVQAGEIVGIMGASGAGKTTLLKLLAGILEPQKGTVTVSGQSLQTMTFAARRRFRLEKIGLIFQDFALLDYLSVEDNLSLPTRLGGVFNVGQKEKTRDFLNRLGISKYRKRPTCELSQGEQQRVAIIRALLHEPLAIFADEPTSSLDGASKTSVMQLLMEEAKTRKTSLIVVTHDTELRPWFDRIIDFKDLRQ